MDVDIVDFNTDPGRFGRESVKIYIDALANVAECVKKDPGLGTYVGADGRVLSFTPDQYQEWLSHERGMSENLVRNFIECARIGRTFVALDGIDKTVGIGNVSVKPYNEAMTVAMSQLFVSPEYQGKGIGRKIMERREKYAIEKLKARYSDLLSMLYVPTIEFHKNRGYDEAGSVQLKLTDTNIMIPQIYMVKSLDILSSPLP
jgi:GNAT superfamily N-acetyltransferase